MNIADDAKTQYMIGLVEKRIEGLKSELTEAEALLDQLRSSKGLATRRRRKRRKEDPRIQELKQLILGIVDSKAIKTGAIVESVKIKDPQYTYEDVRRTLPLMPEMQKLKKGTWIRKKPDET